MNYIKNPMLENKEFTFWHMISEGKIEEKRNLDLRRCERIKWPKPIIENSADEQIKVWTSKRHDHKGKLHDRICFCYGNWDYLVVIEERKKYFIFYTMYLVSGHRKGKLKKEYLRFLEESKQENKHRPFGAASDTLSTHGR